MLAQVRCAWVQESKLEASDRRPGDKFGSALEVDHVRGTLLVGAPHAKGSDPLSRLSTPPNAPYAAGSCSQVTESTPPEIHDRLASQ